MTACDYESSQQNRAKAYKLLSICYYQPEAEMLEQLETLQEVLDHLCPAAAQEIAVARQGPDLQQLMVDYAQLFVGPFRLIAPPYGSVYLEGKREVMGASTVDVQKRYVDAGLQMTDTLKEAPDHVAVELEFIYYLIYKEMEAIETEVPGAAGEWRRRQETFLAKHLGAWIDDFAEGVEEGATTGFYRHLAAATRLFVAGDVESMYEEPSTLCR